MPLARASELDRLLACPGSAFLPREDLRSDYAKGAASWGDAVHLWVETGELPTDHKMRRLLEEKITLSGIARLDLWPDGGTREAALAYNVVSTAVDMMVGGTKEERDAWKASFGDEWITGSADYLSDIFGEPWVDDLKTGRVVSWSAYRAQQSLYALVWSRVNFGGLRQVRSTLTHWPKYPKHNPPNRFGRVLEVDSLSEFAVSLRGLRDKILVGRDLVARQGEGADVRWNTVLSLGEHCGYCPSRRACSMVGEDAPDEGEPQTLGSTKNV